MFELNSENSFNRIAFHHRHHFYDDRITNSSHALGIFCLIFLYRQNTDKWATIQMR